MFGFLKNFAKTKAEDTADSLIGALVSFDPEAAKCFMLVPTP